MFINSSMEYSTARKKNELQLHGTTWVCLTDIMLDERSLIQKNMYCMTSVYIKFNNRQNVTTMFRDAYWAVHY